MQILPMDAYREQVVAVLDRSPLFHGLQPEHLEEAADHAELLRFEDGEALALQGEPSDSFLLLIEGGALVLLEADDDAPPLTLAHISPPDSIGEMGVLLEAPRSASVFAEGGAIVLRFETQQFHSMLLRLPYFGLVLCRTLATRLHQANRRIPLPEMGEPVDHPDDEALSLLPAAFQIRYRVLPLELHGNALRLGTVDELDEAVINLIRQQLPGMQVRVVRVTLDFFEAIMRSQSGVTGFPAPAQYAPGLAGAVVDAPRLDPLVRRMVGEGASDLHLSARQVPRWRVDGELQPLADLGALGPAEVLELLDPVMTPRARLDFETEHDAEFAYEVPEVARFRVKMFRDVHGVCAVLRRIPFRIPTPAQLGVPDRVLGFTERRRGLLLIAGHGGSGRSTTLAALVDHINRTRAGHIITLEDPIEFAHTSQMALINQREIGAHTAGMERALWAARREDPDVTLISELEDADVAGIALEMASTGTLVMAAIAADSAVDAIERFVDLFPAARQVAIRQRLARALVGVVAQALPRRRTGGRVAAFEVLTVDAEVAGHIREQRRGNLVECLDRSMHDALMMLVEAGDISHDEARRKAIDKVEMARRLRVLEESVPPRAR